MRRTPTALVLSLLLVAQLSAAPASAGSSAADAKQTFCTLAKWRSDRIAGQLSLLEPSAAGVAAEAAKLSVPVTLQRIDYAALRSRITALATAVCGAATPEAAKTAWKALLAGQKDIAAQLKTASDRDRDALKAAASAIKAKTKEKMKDAAAAQKAKTKETLDAQKAELAKTYKGEDLKARVRSAAQQQKARAQADLKTQAQSTSKADLDAMRAIRSIRTTLAQRLKAYAAGGKDEWAKVRSQAQQELAALASARVAATCAAASSRLLSAGQQAAKILQTLKARSDQASTGVQQAIEGVSAYAGAIATAQAACATPSGANAGKQVHSALQAAQQAGTRAKDLVKATARTGT